MADTAIDWRTMDPHVCGEGVDAIGTPLPDNTFRVDRLSGKVSKYRTDENGFVLNEAGDDIAVDDIQMIPPITVWLYM